jgi:molybdopterin/thiamine biosynthesis adenylyltransferase
MTGLQDFLQSRARDGCLPWQEQKAAAEHFDVTYRQVEEAALEQGINPARYQRNSSTISCSEQLCLLRSRVAIIGCGGLGGFIVDELARLGVGEITVVDPDQFEESNLNRQVLASFSTLGKSKVEAAARRVREVNPAVQVNPIKGRFSAANGAEILHGANVVVDALDNIPVRLELAQTCGELSIPLVHGAICGWYGQVTTQFPGEDTLEKLYGSCKLDRGMERILGNPSFTPAVVASLEVAEACKILLGHGTLLRRRVLFVNLLEMEMESFSF